jgi:CelD/BcsL family acetyltransferase involved in cellulose biosynthesis
VVGVRGADALAGHAAAWDRLAADALEPNPFYESWMLLPALRAFGGADVSVALAFHPDPAKPHSPPLLAGLFPLQRAHRFKGIPISFLRCWQHLHCFLCTPLLHRQYARAALTAFLDWANADPHGAALVEFNFHAGGGPFEQLLTDLVNERGHGTHVTEAYNRALLCPARDAEAYLTATLSTGNRKELRRLRRRLAETGPLELRTLAPDGDVAAWVEQFLRLEAAGWKGQADTALAAHPAERDYFAAICRGAFARGQLMMLGLFLDGRPVALKCNFLSGPGAFAFKIAFDEQYARFSPGQLLELDNVTAFHDRPQLRWMDSCAVAQHFMINRLWADRRTVRSLLLAPGRWHGELLVAALPLLTWLRRKLRRRKSAVNSPRDSHAPRAD